MKKHLKLVAAVSALIVVAAAVVTFEACNKKNEMVNNIPDLNVAELSDMDKDMILFGERMKSAKKGGETMSVEDAIKNLTNYENFKLSDARDYSSDMKCFVVETTIPVNDGNIYLSDLYAVYESNKTKILGALASLDGDNKTVYCINSTIKENGKDGDEALIKTKAFMYGRDFITPPLYYFDETLYWWTYTECDTCLGGSAFVVLENRLNQSLDQYDCPPGYRIVPYNFYNEVIYSTQYIDPNSPNGHYGLINEDYDDVCLGANEMRYYLVSALNKLTAWKTIQNQYGRKLLYVTYWDFDDSALDADFYELMCTLVGIDD